MQINGAMHDETKITKDNDIDTHRSSPNTSTVGNSMGIGKKVA